MTMARAHSVEPTVTSWYHYLPCEVCESPRLTSGLSLG